MIPRAKFISRTLRRAPAPLTRPLARGYASTDYRGKVSVVPFAQTPEQARERLLVHGLLASAQATNIIMAGILRIAGSVAEPLCREFGLGESLVLRDMRPVYYPIWRVDVIAEGPVRAKGGEESTGWMAVREGYLPGNAYAPLSYISYAVPPLVEPLPTYNPAKDLRQLDGAEIVEVPFNVSPFAMLEKIRRRLGTVAIGGLRIEQAQWKETMVAAYPVMFPMYIAEFEHTAGDETRRYSVIMDAHDTKISDCRVSFPPPDEMRETGRLAKNYYVNPAPFLPSANLILPVTESAFEAPSPPPAAVMAKAYQRWMSPEPTGSTIPASPTYSITDTPIDWADPRIMPWGGAEHELNGDYMEKGLEVNRNIEALRAMTLVSDQFPNAEPLVAIGKRVSKESMSNVVRDIADSIEKEKGALEDMKPQWLRDYDASKEPKAEAGGAQPAEAPSAETPEPSPVSEGASEHKQ